MRGSPERPSDRRGFAWGLLAVLVVSAIAYAPSLQNGLTNWDDEAYVVTNPWLGPMTPDALAAVFSTFYRGNYHPLTLLSLWTDWRVSGGSVAVYHATNLLFQLLNTGLVGLLALRLSGRGGVALAVAALFGLHPIHVESVAWVSERKDVLFVLFYLGALLFYLHGIGATRARARFGWISIAWLLFLASLLSKGTAVSLAPTLLAVDWLAGRRFRSLGLWLEKLPFFALALLSGWITISAQSDVGQLAGTSVWSPTERLVLAGWAYARYLALLVAPIGLSAFHPYPERIGGGLPAAYGLGLVVFLGVQALTVWLMRRARLIAFGLAFFTINIALMLQLIPIGGALIAERYAYLPSIGFFLAVATAVDAWGIGRPRWRLALVAVGLAYALTLGVGTWQRSGVWQNSMTLWNDTLARYPRVPVARLNRALAHHAEGRLGDALEDLSVAVDAQPRYARALAHRGVLRFEAGDPTGALRDLDRAAMIEPSVDTYLNRGAVRLAAGQAALALADLDRVVTVDPGRPLAWSNRGIALARLGRDGAALRDFDRALRLAPGFLAARVGRAEALVALGNASQALLEADALLADDPSLGPAHRIRGQALLATGDRDPGCAALERALALGDATPRDSFPSACADDAAQKDGGAP